MRKESYFVITQNCSCNTDHSINSSFLNCLENRIKMIMQRLIFIYTRKEKFISMFYSPSSALERTVDFYLHRNKKILFFVTVYRLRPNEYIFLITQERNFFFFVTVYRLRSKEFLYLLI